MQAGYNRLCLKSTGRFSRSGGYRIGLDRYRLSTISQRFIDTPDSLKLKLNKVFPNPFGSNIRLEYTLADNGRVVVSVFDVNGRLIRRLSDRNQLRRDYSVLWDGRDTQGHSCPAGIYFVDISFKTVRKTAIAVLVR